MARMARTLVAIWGTAIVMGALLVYLGVQVAPCLGGVGPGEQARRERCVAAWEAQRPWLDRVLGSSTEWLVVVITAALVGSCIVLLQARRETREI